MLTANHPLLLLSSEFSSLCEPLKLLDINHFTYQKQFYDGNRINLSTSPQWVEDYYQLKFYQSSLFEQNPADQKSGFNVWIGEYDLAVYRHGKQRYNTTHSITITQPQHDGVEHFLFSVAAEHEQAIHFLTNNMDILYRFILYIKDRGKRLFKSAHKNKLMISDFKIDRSQMQNNQQDSLQKIELAKKLFLKKIPIHNYIFEDAENHGINLTQREMMCISHLLKNKTAHETGVLLNLSRRTVESYLDNIKIKLNCDTKIELMDKIKNHKFLSSLTL